MTNPKLNNNNTNNNNNYNNYNSNLQEDYEEKKKYKTEKIQTIQQPQQPINDNKAYNQSLKLDNEVQTQKYPQVKSMGVGDDSIK